MTSPTPTLTDEQIIRIALATAGAFDELAVHYQTDSVLSFARAILAANEAAPAAAPEGWKELWSYEWQDENGGWNTVWKPHSVDYDLDKGHRNLRRWAASPSVEGVGSEAELAKEQPCGCVICTCEDEEQCHGCGAKHCGEHAVGRFSNPFFQALDKALAVPASPLPQG